ncbi:hypothetical protein ACNQ2I_02345 [Mycoplasma sp. Z355B]|uniref:hypothetical protein n=1 Tax=Mycoplasma sp. Z355B TaxID=3401689 RepID=UPI003AAA8CDE
MNSKEQKKTILTLWWTFFLLIIILVAAIWGVCFGYTSWVVFKTGTDQNAFNIALVSLLAIWFIPLSITVIYYFTYSSFNFMIRFKKSTRNLKNRFPEEKSKMISFIYRYFYILNTDEANNVRWVKSSKAKCNLVKFIIAIMPIFTVLLPISILGLIIYVATINITVFYVYISVFVLGIMWTIYSTKITIYLLVKWNGMNGEDFKNFYLKMLFNLWGSKYPFNMLKWQIESLIPSKPDSQENYYQ